MAAENGGPPAQELQEFQFVIQSVLLLVEDGKTPRPIHADPQVLTGLDELREFIAVFPDQLAKLNEQGVPTPEMEKSL